MSRHVILILRRGEETQTVKFNLNTRGALRIGKKISQYMKNGWELEDAQGDKQIAGYLRSEVARYKQDKAKYRADVKEVVKLGVSLTKRKKK